jgi:hypothetical protein
VSLFIARDLANIGTSVVNVQVTRRLSDPGVRLFNGSCILHCNLSTGGTTTFYNGEIVIQEK